MANGGDEMLEMAALGRPFQLGMLYDCRKDRLIPGITLWNLEELQGSISKKKQSKTEFSITTSDSIEDKTSALKVEGSLKASLLVGLVKVGGAANYYNDTRKSTRQSRVTLQYYTTTTFENLTMNHLAKGKVSHPSVFEDNTATHVVTAVLYGAQAYFVFDQEVSLEGKQCDIRGEMELAISQIPTFPIKGKGSVDFKEKELAEVEKFKCTFYGDFHLESNPSNYQDAVKAYSTLPQLLGDNGENAVPVKVWLYPLIKLDSRAARLERNISDSLVTSAYAIVEQLNAAEMRSNDILKGIVAQKFPEVSEKIEQLKKRCTEYKLNFQSELSTMLPSIRGGKKDEKPLIDILNNHEESPFKPKALNAWLESKEREIRVVRSFLDQLKDIPVVSSINKLEQEVLDHMNENIVCFTFTSLYQPEPYLLDLKNYLQTPLSKNPPSFTYEDSKLWACTENIQKIRMALNVFQEIVDRNRENKKTKFFIASKEDQEFPGACILLYENRQFESTYFKTPSKPDVPEVCGVTHDSITLKVVPPSSDADQKLKYQLEYKCINEIEWAIQSGTDKSETFTVSGLQPDTEYQFRYTVEGKLWYTVTSDTTCKVKTRSPPEQNTGGLLSSFRNVMLPGVPSRNTLKKRVNKNEVDNPQAPKQKNRAKFIKYSCKLTMDPNTVHRNLCLSEGNRKVNLRSETKPYPDHPDRFDSYLQVLCREGLSKTRCYWEIELSGGGALIGVTYKGISRKGEHHSCILGYNDKSWSLHCCGSSYTAWHNNNETTITAPCSSRIGVHLDFNAGTLSFYRVSDKSSLLYKFKTTFTEPLYPGFCIRHDSTVTICQLN
ncbi:stonustoxin subunit alpha-like [Acipenser ruthenus]|uniref:stonustoxin subunit alpha-like n=1 Tax=Acipenser ruthenus TaxID=7906 RepID=UPI002742102C|nr:stonustoxin subunit alpha-like [Acipenser ruthenus]